MIILLLLLCNVIELDLKITTTNATNYQCGLVASLTFAPVWNWKVIISALRTQWCLLVSVEKSTTTSSSLSCFFLSFFLFLVGLRKRTLVLSRHGMPISQLLADSSSCSPMGNVISFKSLTLEKNTWTLTIIRLAQTWRSEVWCAYSEKKKKMSVVRRHSYLNLIHYSATTSCCSMDAKLIIHFAGCRIPFATLKKQKKGFKVIMHSWKCSSKPYTEWHASKLKQGETNHHHITTFSCTQS